MIYAFAQPPGFLARQADKTLSVRVDHRHDKIVGVTVIDDAYLDLAKFDESRFSGYCPYLCPLRFVPMPARHVHKYLSSVSGVP
jgi:hypothetical protein